MYNPITFIATMTKKAHSDFWLRNRKRLREQFARDMDKLSPEYILELNQVRRGIANFVRIVTGEPIPVRFSSGKDSYASMDEEGRRGITISATNDPDEFDSNVGIALHEAAHLILSDKTRNPDSVPLYDFLRVLRMGEVTAFLPHGVEEHMERVGLEGGQVKNLIKEMINILEDRRIDRWMYRTAIGYRGYYDEMYAKYWLHPDISKHLVSDETRVPTINNYRFHICNMINAEADPDALPGLREIWELFDLQNIDRFNKDDKWSTYQDHYKERFVKVTTARGTIRSKPVGRGYELEVLPDIVATAIRAVCIILENAEPQPSDDDLDTNASVGSGDPGDDNYDMADDVGDDDGVDDDDDQDVDSDVDDILDKQSKFLDGDVDKEKVTEAIKEMLDAMEGANSELKVVDGEFGRAKVVVFNKLTPNLINSEAFPFSQKDLGVLVRDRGLEASVNEGIRMGNLLAHRLQVIADERPLKYTRQEHGTIDKRLLAGLGYGDVNVFQQSTIERYKPVELHFTVDASISMRGPNWNNAVKLASALAVAGTKVRNLHVVVSFRAGSEIAYVVNAFDSRVDTVSKVRSLFPYLSVVNGTPEGLAFAAIKDTILRMGDRTARKFFVNISDGEPFANWYEYESVNGQEIPVLRRYHDDAAYKHTAEQVQDIRKSGIKVMSYFVSRTGTVQKATEAAFRKMYGRDAQFIRTDSVSEIARTLNSLFLAEN